MEQLKQYVPTYVNELNITHGDVHGLISCLVPGHTDSNPSMGYFKAAKHYHCFSCGESFDIFRVATEYEDKPGTGKGFIKDNVFYLAEKFGVPYEHINIEFTPEDLEKFKQYDIMKIVSQHVKKNVNDDYIAQRNISKEIASELLIGSVDWKSLENLLKESNFIFEDYAKLGINSRNLNENKLVIIIKDNEGRPVSFVSREMLYVEKTIADKISTLEMPECFKTKKARKEFIISKLGQMADRYLNTPKYINGIASLIYNKSEIFYGYSDIKNKMSKTSKLFIVEG